MRLGPPPSQPAPEGQVTSVHPVSRRFAIASSFAAALGYAKLGYAKKKPDMPDVTVTRQDNGTSVKLGLHRILRIDLPENPSTGYGWQMNGLNGAVLSLKETTYQREGKAAPGAAGIRTYKVQAIGVGHQLVSLELKRTWERESEPSDRFSVTVDVVQPK